MKSAYQYMTAIAALCFFISVCAAADEPGSSALAKKEKILGSKKFREHEAKIEETKHRFPDGAYGFGWGYVPGRIYTPASDSKELTARSLSSLYCGSEAIVVATLLNSNSFLNDEESLVLTAWRFKIVNTLKADQGLAMGPVLSLVMPGGEVVKNSKKLRIKNTFIGEYEKRKQYLLFLDRPAGETLPVY